MNEFSPSYAKHVLHPVAITVSGSLLHLDTVRVGRSVESQHTCSMMPKQHMITLTYKVHCATNTRHSKKDNYRVTQCRSPHLLRTIKCVTQAHWVYCSRKISPHRAYPTSQGCCEVLKLRNLQQAYIWNGYVSKIIFLVEWTMTLIDFYANGREFGEAGMAL